VTLLPLPPRAALLSQPPRRAASTARAGTEAVPFAVHQADVPAHFAAWWSRNHVGLSQPRLDPRLDPHRVRSVFLPFWVFTAEVTIPSARVFARPVGGPHLMIYSGGEYPRAMTEVLKADATSARPFTARLLELDGGAVTADVEPFELFEATAWQLVRAGWLRAEAARLGCDPAQLGDAAFSGVTSRRVLLPAHVVEYRYMFETFRAYVSGVTGDGYGVQQQGALGGLPSAGALLERLSSAKPLLDFLQRHLPPQAALALANAAVLLLRPLLKFALWPPFLVGSAAALGGFALRRLTSGARAQRRHFAEWEETRRAEARLQASMTDDWQFRPLGETAADRARAAARAAEAEAAAARDRQRRAREAYTRTHEQQQQAQQRERDAAAERQRAAEAAARRRPAQAARPAESTTATGRKPPPVDASDCYAVLGLAPAASEEDVKHAFRRELMKWHPDHQDKDGGWDLAACSERTRVVIAAYGTLRDPARRAAYDATRRGGGRR
jgi:hypothetical protein